LPVGVAAFDSLVLNGQAIPERRAHRRLPFRPDVKPAFVPHFTPNAAPANGAPDFTPNAAPPVTGSWQRPRMPIADRSRERYRFS